MPDAVPTLFSPYDLNGLELTNRVVMASMTRGRARPPGLVPSELHVEYYRQRASAGLILTEATWISPESIGFINVPGLYTAAQTAGWRKVVEAVHAEGGRIYAQLAHSGAGAHPDFFDGEPPLAPSAVNPGLKSFTATGFKDTVTPRAMTVAQIRTTVEDYAAAGRNAREAGFDGVEVHCATTYLLPEFLNSTLNVRQDEYGGSVGNRARIVIEILQSLIDVCGPGRVGIKISPAMAMGGFGPTDQTVATYDHLIERLNEMPLSHLQLVRAMNDLTGTPIQTLQDTVAYYRARFKGTLIANCGYDRLSATEVIASRRADLVAFATAYVGNPDLVRRLNDDLPLSASGRDTYYQGAAEGYTDYPAAP